MGVVEKAFEKCVPPFSMMCRVLFMACIEPERERGYREEKTTTKHSIYIRGTAGLD